MVLEKVKLYLDGTMLRFESDDKDFRTRSVPTGRIEAAFQGDGFTFTDVVQETLVCSVDSFDDVLDAAGAVYGASQEAVAVALNVFLNFKAGSAGSTDYVENVALNGDSLDFTAIGSAFGGSVNLSGLGDNFANANLTLDDDRAHDFNGKYMLLNSVGFTSPTSTEPSFILDPIGSLFGAAVVGFKSGLLSGVNTTLLQQDDGGGLKTVIQTQDSSGDLHFLQVTQGRVLIEVENGGDSNNFLVDKDNGAAIKVEIGALNIDIPTADTAGKVLTLTNATTKEVEFTDISSTGALLAPNVADESARDIAYPSPSDGQRVFNSRTQEIETYASAFGLWLSPTKKVAIRQTALLVDRFVYINSFFTVSGVAYPALTYPTDAANENQTYGVIVEIGDSIDVARDFVAVAVGNQQFVDFGEAIAVGEYVSAKIAGVNQDLGFAAGNATTSGRAGIALQNSGATIGKPTKVLVQLNLLAESF